MTAYFLTTEWLNLLNGVASALTPTPSADANFPISYLTDRDQATPFRFGSNAANPQVIADLNRVLNGGFDTWPGTLADNWFNDSVGTGAITKETTLVNTGPNAAKLTGGGGGNEAKIRATDVPMRAGWAFTVTFAIRGDGTNAISIYIQNRVTTRNVTLEAASVAQRPVYDLRITAEQTTGDGYLDDVYCWPHWDFAALLGHNLGSMLTTTVQSDDNSGMSSPTTRVTFTLRRPSMYGLPAAMVTERYARLLLTGTNHEASELGEWILGQRETIPDTPPSPGLILPFSIAPRADLVGVESGKPSARFDHAPTTMSVALQLGETQWDDMRISLLDAGKLGGLRTLIVPLDTRPEVYYGSLFLEGVQRVGAGAVYELSGILEEQRYGVRVT